MRLQLQLFLPLIAALAASPVFAQTPKQPNAPAASPAPVKSVLELFTSQGCSSCPHADALLEQYTAKPGVLALTYSVDYWDYLGWKDTLAQAKFTKRQKLYARARGDGEVYTPQMVVNGMTHGNGADQSSIERALTQTAKATQGRWVPISVRTDGGHLVVDAAGWPDAASPVKDATLWLLTLTPRVDVIVKRGENSGKALSYFNVVREMTAIGMWAGQPMSRRIERSAVASNNDDTFAVVLQVGDGGAILGAALLPKR